MPALHERPEDIPLLVNHFLQKNAAHTGMEPKKIDPKALELLTHYRWPGNVRELENAIERAVVLGESDVLLPEDLPETVLESAAVPEPPGALVPSVTESKRQLILAAWREAAGDHNQAASRLNIHPNSLRRLIRTLHLRDALG